MSKPGTTVNESSLCECPYCGHHFQWRKWHKVFSADEQQCPSCNWNIQVIRVEHITKVTLAITTSKGDDACPSAH